MTSKTRSAFLPILLTCAGYACYNIGDVTLKLLLQKLHASQVMVVSGCVLIVFMAAYGALKEGKKAFRTNKPKAVLAHAVLYLGSVVANVLAFPHLQLTTFYTLVFTSPFMVALLSHYWLKDKMDKRAMAVILFGFCVILYIFRPGGGLLNVWALLILFSSFLYSCRMILVRQIGSGESRSFLFITSAVVSVVVGVAFLGDHYVPLDLTQWGLFLLTGFVSCTGLLCLGYAFQEAPSASVIAPYHYTQIIWGGLLGYYFFGDVPDTRTMVGAALLIAAGLYLIRHEMRKAAVKPPEV